MGKEIAESCFPFTLGCHSFGKFPLVAGGQFIPGRMSSGEYGGGSRGGPSGGLPKRIAETSQAEAGPLRALPDRGAPIPWVEAEESLDRLQERAEPLAPAVGRLPGTPLSPGRRVMQTKRCPSFLPGPLPA